MGLTKADMEQYNQNLGYNFFDTSKATDVAPKSSSSSGGGSVDQTPSWLRSDGAKSNANNSGQSTTTATGTERKKTNTALEIVNNSQANTKGYLATALGNEPDKGKANAIADNYLNQALKTLGISKEMYEQSPTAQRAVNNAMDNLRIGYENSQIRHTYTDENGNTERMTNGEYRAKKSTAENNAKVEAQEKQAEYTQAKEAQNEAELAAAYDVTDGMSSRKYLEEAKANTIEKSAEANKAQNEADALKYGNVLNKATQSPEATRISGKGLQMYNPEAQITKAEDPGNKILWADNHQDLISNLKDDTSYDTYVHEYENLSYATEDERTIYNYLLASEGSESADKYLDYIRPDLNARAGMETAQGIASDTSNTSRVMREVSASFLGGVKGGKENILQNFTDEARPMTADEYTNAFIQQDITNRKGEGMSLEKAITSAAQSIGNMIPNIAAGIVTGGAGGSIVGGLSARGATYRQLVQEGYTTEQAQSMANIMGVAEGVTQYFLGGISAMGGKLTGMTSEKLLGNISNSLLKSVAELGLSTVSESAEEVLQNKIEALAGNAILGKNDKVWEWTQEDWDTVIITALSTIVLEAPSSFSNNFMSADTTIDPNTQSRIDDNIANLEVIVENAEMATANRMQIADSSVYNKLANNIIRNADLTNQFEMQYGEIQGTSNTERAKYVSETLRNAAIAEANGMKNTIASLDNPTVESDLHGYNPATEITNTAPETTQTAAPQQTVNPETEGQIGAVMHIREMVREGVTFSGAREIYNDPQLRQVFEDMYGITLSEKPGTAREQIVAAAKNAQPSLQYQMNETDVDYNPYQGAHTAESTDYTGKHEAVSYPKTHNQVNPDIVSENGAHVAPDPYVGKHVAPETETVNPALDIARTTEPDINLRPNPENAAINTVTENAPNLPPQQTVENTQQTSPQDVQNGNEVGQNEFNLNPVEQTGEQTQNAALEATNADWRTAQQQQIDKVMAQNSEGGEQVSQHNDTTVKNAAVHPELREKYATNPDTYGIKTNKGTLEEALGWIEKGTDIEGTDNAYTHVRDLLADAKNGKKLPAYAVPLATMVENELTEAGHIDLATDIHSSMGVELTLAGQFIQAVRIMQNTSPQTVLQTMQKAIDKINEDISKAYGKNYTWRAELTPAEIATIKNTDFSDKAAYKDVYKSIMERLGKEMPSTLGEKATELRRINMLLRPKTMIKNVAANVPTIAIRAVDNTVSGAIQDLMVKTGIMKADEQTRTAVYSAESKSVAKEVCKSIQSELNGNGSKWENDSRVALNQERTIFKTHDIKIGDSTFRIGGLAPQATEYLINKLGGDVEFDKSSLEYLREATYGLLEAGDVPFVNAAFTDALAKYCDAHGITSVDQVTQEAIDFALADAEYYTYKSSNALAKAVNKLKNNGVVGGIVDYIIPFTTTPFNIAKMLVDHNPIAAGVQATVNLAQGNKTATIDNISRGVTGSLTMLAGLLLRNSGLITGGEDDDKDKAAWDKSTGNQAYAIKGKYTYDWAEPAGSMMAFGADISDAINASDDADFKDAFWNAVWTMGDAFFNMSMIQNVTKILKGSGSPTETLVKDVITSAGGQYSSGLMSSVAASMDSKNRVTYDDNPIKEFLNTINYAIPGKHKIGNLEFGRETLPEKVNVKGETETRGNEFQRWLNNNITPWNTNYGSMDKVDEMLETVYQETNSTAIFPDRFNSKQTIKDSTGASTDLVLTPEEQNKGQKIYSDYYYGVLGKMSESKIFENLDTDAIERIITNVKDLAKDQALSEIANGRGLEHAFDNKYSTLTSGEIRKGTDYGKLSKDNALDYIMYDCAYRAASNADDYGTMDKLINDFGTLPKAVQDEYLTRNSSFETMQKIIDAGWSTEEFYNEFKGNIDKMQWMFDTAGQNGLVKLSALVDSNVTEKQKEDLAPVVLNKTQNKMFQAMKSANPETTMSQFYQVWRSCYNQIDPDGVVLTNSNLSQATLYDTLVYWGEQYNWSLDVYDSVWNGLLNEPPTYQCNGLKTKFDMDYESNSKPGSWGANKYGSSKVTVTYPDGETVELKYGTDYTIDKDTYGSNIRTTVPPPKGSTLSIDDGNAAPSYHTFESYAKKVAKDSSLLKDSKFTPPPDGFSWKMDTGKALDNNDYNPYDENQLF